MLMYMLTTLNIVDIMLVKVERPLGNTKDRSLIPFYFARNWA